MIKKGLLTLFFIGFSLMWGNVFAQSKIQLQEGVFLVNYAGTYVIEDENNQRSISIEITQEQVDNRNNEAMYRVVCGKWTRRVVKDGLDAAIKAGLDAAAATKGVSLTVTAVAKAAKYIYDDVCDYWEKKNNARNPS